MEYLSGGSLSDRIADKAQAWPTLQQIRGVVKDKGGGIVET